MKTKIFENNDARLLFRHLTHILQIDIWLYQYVLATVCAFHFHSIAKDKSYFVQSLYCIPVKMTNKYHAIAVLQIASAFLDLQVAILWIGGLKG